MLEQPWIVPGIVCLEEVINDARFGTLAFAALTVDANGVLYAADTLGGTLYRFSDTDGDLLPDTARVIADGMLQPTGIVSHDDTLYIAGRGMVYRYEDESLQVVIDDIPAQVMWGGGIAVHENRLYIGMDDFTQDCRDFVVACRMIASYALDGGDRQIERTGLYQPFDMAVVETELWATDIATDQIMPSTAPIALEPDSSPLGIAYYDSDTIPFLTNKLIVALAGSADAVNLTGYQVVLVDVTTHDVSPLMPFDITRTYANREMNYRGSGFFPHRPLDVAVSPQGWVYISISDGRILALRPL
jgi:glucose/arabinose dehydrogenase